MTVQELWYTKLNFCNCGCPEEVLTFIRNVLRAINDRFKDEKHIAVEENKLLPYDGPFSDQCWIIRYWLDSLGWTEYGGSVVGAWLTDEGKEVLALLESCSDFDKALDNQ